MASQASLTTVQKLYVAYYGRPADPAGLTFWADKLDAQNGSLTGIIDAFAGEPEALALYGGTTTPTDRINILYQNILGRAPDQTGLDYYRGELEAGRISLGNLTLAILNGARDTDLPLIQNRLNVAQAATGAVA